MNDPHDPEELDDSDGYREALLNGDERFNKFVKLTDRRFESQARRTNKRAKEMKDDFEALRLALAPLIELSHVLAGTRRVWPIFAAVGSAAVFVGGTVIALGIWP